MLKKENLVWLYLLGIVIMLIIVFLVGRDYLLPIASGRRSTAVETGFNYSAPPKFALEQGRDYRARLMTSQGTVLIDLFENAAPTNVNNFVYLARENYYDGTYFHRLVPGLFLQGGDRNTLNDDPSDDGLGGPGYVLEDEINWSANGYDAAKRSELAAAGYTSADVPTRPLAEYGVAMASAGPNTIGSQFFIVLGGASDPRVNQLDGRYTVIGEVILGRDLLTALASTEIDASNPLVPRPIRKLTLTDIEIFTTN